MLVRGRLSGCLLSAKTSEVDGEDQRTRGFRDLTRLLATQDKSGSGQVCKIQTHSWPSWGMWPVVLIPWERKEGSSFGVESKNSKEKSDSGREGARPRDLTVSSVFLLTTGPGLSHFLPVARVLICEVRTRALTSRARSTASGSWRGNSELFRSLPSSGSSWVSSVARAFLFGSSVSSGSSPCLPTGGAAL